MTIVREMLFRGVGWIAILAYLLLIGMIYTRNPITGIVGFIIGLIMVWAAYPHGNEPGARLSTARLKFILVLGITGLLIETGVAVALSWE